MTKPAAPSPKISTARGRVGIIVPSGIATDDTTKYFFADLVENRALVSLFDFVNNVGLFPGVGHGRMRFSLLTMAGNDTPAHSFEVAFCLSLPADLHEPGRRYELAPDDFELLNPNTRTCPVFRTERDAMVVRAIYHAIPVLQRDSIQVDSGWSPSFLRMFDMASDSAEFADSDELVARGAERSGPYVRTRTTTYVPLLEAKMLAPFNHRWGDYAMRAAGSRDTELPVVDVAFLSNPSFIPTPKYWVTSDAVRTKAREPDPRWFMGWRDVTKETNERTLVPAIVPPVGVGHKFPLIRTPEPAPWLLFANLSSFVVDYVCRQKFAAVSLTYFVMKQLPILPTSSFEQSPAWSACSLAEWVSSRVIELVYTAWDLELFANDLGWHSAPFKWNEDRRSLLRAELDACFFHLYGIERDDVDYILGTFPIVNRKDVDKFGEERTRRLILERYDALAEAIATGKPYETVLDPPPADPSVAHSESTRPDWARPVSRDHG
jgi:hypothetical protein